ncbi:MAG: DNA methyltransferase [Desulfotomaculaceae bacterium]|nr:DNA methyltransferase [Desulfotomaculaceae bacterium]
MVFKDMKQITILDQGKDTKNQPVTCLGMTFANDEARRAHFIEELRKKLPELKQMEGFPIGEDEDILALSDPPYYTACPNPFIKDFLQYYGKPYDSTTDNYRRDPFSADVSEGKNDPIYNAHSYHTKVPHKAIMRYILHYTDPGDIVFDGFCGTGMTGVAARECGENDPDTKEKISLELPDVKWGERYSVQWELSPAATFIAQGYNLTVLEEQFYAECKEIHNRIGAAYAWMYKTRHTSSDTFGEINYVIWSDVFICNACGGEIVYWDVAIDHKEGRALDNFECPHCRAKLSKRELERAWSSTMDRVKGRIDRTPKKVPVEINYTVGNKTFRKQLDDYDRSVLQKIDDIDIENWFPDSEIPPGLKTDEPRSLGITHQDLFFTRRNLICASALWACCHSNKSKFVFTSLVTRLSKLSNLHISNYFSGGGGAASGNMKGMLHPPTVSLEQNPLKYWPIRVNAVEKILRNTSTTIIGTGSSTKIPIPNNSVDYMFIDPPFGSNLAYSDLNTIWESWLRVSTKIEEEAIVNKRQGKTLLEYQTLITNCFREFCRILKPGRWITVEFSNTKASVWTSLQQAIEQAGFIVANVAILDKKQGGYNSNVYAGAVKQDLAISAYKPNGGLEDRFKLEAGTEDGVWDFIRTHLKHLPVFISENGQAEIIVERQNFLLYDRMVAFHVQRGVTVPLSATEFYAGLDQRFPERDGMYFLPDQVAEYDKKRLTVREILQLQLFVTDESSAIKWLKQQITRKPQTFQEIHPQFLKEISGWQKYEKPLELSELLEQNFLRYDGKGEVPSQIHSCLSTNFKDLRNLAKDDETLRSRGKDHWYVPDPNKAGDLEKLREKSLLREFAYYIEEMKKSKKKLKQFRTEAIRAGFKKAWGDKDYQTIVDIGQRLPESILQEDDKLLMYYDNAQIRLGI